MFIFLILFAHAEKNCLWHDKGFTYDLNKLHKTDNYQVPDTDTSMGMFNMLYEFNFCGGVVKCQGRDVAAFEALQVMGKLTENCDVLGIKETQEFKYLNPSNPESGISVTYKQGDMCFDVKEEGGLEKIIQDGEQMSMTPRSVTFEITCGHDEQNFKVVDSSKCNIRLGITHSSGCRAGTSPSSSLTYLKYLVIIALLYFLGGFAYNKKQGNAQIPHAEFWREFPLYFKDGINFSLAQGVRIIGRVKGFQERGYATV